MSLHGKSSHEDNVIAEEIDGEENPATTKFVSTESEHQFYTEKVNLLQDKRRLQQHTNPFATPISVAPQTRRNVDSSHSSSSSTTIQASSQDHLSPDLAKNETSPSEQHFLSTGGNCKALLAMCIGLHGKEDSSFCDPKEDKDYKRAKDRLTRLPNAKDLKKEVIRHHALENPGKKEKGCRSWTIGKCKEWLLDHPIVNKACRQFLEKEEQHVRSIVVKSIEESASSAVLAPTADSWVGMEPYLRLFHAMVENEVYASYMKIHEWQDRASTDARSSDIRPKTFYELCAEKFNDEEFWPITKAYPSLHDDFQVRHVLKPYNMPVVTGDKIKEKLGTLRCNLMRIVMNWDKSGNGSGQRAETDEAFGHIDPKSQKWLNVTGDGEEEYVDGDNRKSFLGNHKSYYLYMWAFFDEHDMLHQTFSKLSSEVSVSSDTVPSSSSVPLSVTQKLRHNKNDKTERQRVKQEREEKEDRRVRKKISRSFEKLAYSDLNRNIKDLLKDQFDLKLRMLRSNDSEEQKLIEDHMAANEDLIGQLRTRLQGEEGMEAETTSNEENEEESADEH